jgi:hypothetical protein
MATDHAKHAWSVFEGRRCRSSRLMSGAYAEAVAGDETCAAPRAGDTPKLDAF